MKCNYSVIVALLFLSTLACSRGGDEGTGGGGGVHIVTPTDTTRPEIVIFTPTDNQAFSSGNTINISGRVTDDLGLYQGTIRIVNDATGFVLVNQPYVIHGLLLYNFSLNHTTAVAATTNYTITINFDDHGSNSTTRSVKVKVNP